MVLQTKIKIIALITFGLFSCLVFVPKGSTQSKVETAGQKFKNIKVLNDLPADQLGKVMNLFSADLGVDCNFCHEGENFEKDSKKEKEDARKMIKMTLGINKDNFNSRSQVTCNSCHNGHHQPTNVPNLMPVAEAQRPKQPDVKPTVDQIVTHYMTALGGADKLAKVTSIAIKANRIEPDGKTMEPEMVYFKEGKYALDTTYGKATISERYDGKTAAKYYPGMISLKADEAEQIKRDAEMFAPGNLKTIYPKMDFRLLDKLDGRDVYVISATTLSNVRETLFFDVLTGFLVRRAASTQTMFGRYVYQVDYADYKAVGGVKMPMTIKYSMPAINWTRKILEAKVNVPVDEAKFKAPAGSN